MDKRIRHTSELELAATKRARYFLDSAIDHIDQMAHLRSEEKAVLIAGFMQAAATSYLAEALQDHVGDPLSGISEDMSGMIKRNL
ncbi:hypothetical protein [Pseudomonas aeruginosa]|uniref:hypothetical protein n=1 Tax=Pseudomonas aeruginosa TaxID=287 RepID=UPI00053E1D2A|nr:hypothetical protein [Pseudomonas aeruginosa]KSE74722.1 hypothetical protein AO924_29130 [Pseudomonas aeruginosa]MEB6159122.1 hypothetical protein [Pseudomonas aeruginosa]HBO2319976.1 hypothetical protein [Pseudomonas aeruginosa]